MSSMAENVIAASGDKCPPMLERSQYDSVGLKFLQLQLFRSLEDWEVSSLQFMQRMHKLKSLNVLFHLLKVYTAGKRLLYVKRNKVISLGMTTSKVGIEVQQLFLKGLYLSLSLKEITPQLSINYIAIMQARNTNHLKDSELASLFGKLKYKENLTDSIYETEKNKSFVSATPLSTAFFSIQEAVMNSKAATVKNKGLIAKAYEWDEEEVSSNDNEMVEKRIIGVDQLTEGPSSSGQKYLVFLKSLADDIKVSIPGVERPWLSEAEGFILPNHDTGRILPAESQRNTTDPLVAVTDSSVTKYDSANESSVCSTFIPPLKKLDGAEPVSRLKTIKSILSSKSTFKAKTLKGVIINEPFSAPAKGNKSSPASKVNSTPAEREINSRNPQHAFKRCEACGSSTHTTTDHYDIEWFKRGEALQAKNVEALKSTKDESSNANRSKTPTKSYMHKYVEQPGSKVVFGDDFTCTTEGYGSIKCNGIVFIKFDEKRGTIFNSNKEIVMIAPRKASTSFKTKQTSFIKKCLHLLHMDLFGPVTPSSINHDKYTLVIVDEYSRYTWVYFLKKKSQAPETIMSFIKRVENQNDIKVKQLRTNNGIEFRNSILVNFCDEKGISQNFSSPYTPEQNSVAERKNRTLIEAARTMLSGSVFSKQY
ncbi:retrovirus-related pol polyprotein from transposon TNT 1-94 [Tanacetum coccineum]